MLKLRKARTEAETRLVRRHRMAPESGKRQMTVGVAAFGNIRIGVHPFVVVASDRIITIDDIEYEPEQTKSVVLASQTVALLAGEMEVHAAVLPTVIEGLRSNPPPGFLIKTIAERYAQEFAYHRRYMNEQEILMPLGLTTDDFLKRQSEMSHEFVRDVADKLLNRGLKASAIIAGVDQTGAHIYKIVDPGVAMLFDTPCFAAIGTGQPHAESHLMTTGFHKGMSVAETVYAVFSAKTKAEIAAGVGSKTDLMIIRGGIRVPQVSGGSFPAKPDEIKMLRKLFDTEQATLRQATNQAIQAVEVFLGDPTGENREPQQSGMPPAPEASADEPPDAPEVPADDVVIAPTCDARVTGETEA